MRLQKPINGIFALDYKGLFLAFDMIYVCDDGRVNFYLWGNLVSEFRSKKLSKFAKVVRKYDKKNGTDLIKEWGLEGTSDE